MVKKYEFEKLCEDGLIRYLICPNCGESVSSVDIESYVACPYCNQQLENNADLEDFSVDPLVRSWVEHYTAANASRGRQQ